MGLLALRVPIVRLLFESGQFTARDTQATATALLFYSFGLFSQSGIQLITKTFYSIRDTRTPVKIGLLNVVVNTLLSILFLRTTSLGHGGLALAFSLTSLVNLVVFLHLLRRELGTIDGGRIVTTTLKSILASAVMGLGVVLVAGRLERLLNMARFSGRFLQVGISILFGVLVYTGMVFLLRMEEVDYIIRLVKQRLRSRA